jgi:hypothetical protein
MPSEEAGRISVLEGNFGLTALVDKLLAEGA